MRKLKLIFTLMLTLALLSCVFLAGCQSAAPTPEAAPAPIETEAVPAEAPAEPKVAEEPTEELDWPNGPISGICPWSAGGASDVAFRAYLSYIATELGTDINVQNVTGGDGSIGIAQALAAPADGNMVAMLNYDLLSNEIKGITTDSYKDFAIISLFTMQNINLIVRTDSGWDTFEDFVQAAKDAKAAGKTLQIGINGFWLHAAGLMCDAAGISDCVTMVPSDGSSVLMTELLGGHVDAVTSSASVALPHIESGNMKILGVMGEERNAMFPDVPTFQEMGYPTVVIAGFRALGVSKDTPAPIVEKWREAAKKAFDNPEFQAWATDANIDQVYLDADETVAFFENLYPSVKSTMEKLGLI